MYDIKLLTTVHKRDIALDVVLCNTAKVLAVETATTPHLIGGNMPHNLLRFLLEKVDYGAMYGMSLLHCAYDSYKYTLTCMHECK